MAKGWVGVEHRETENLHAKDSPWVFRCPLPNCYYVVTAKTEEQIREFEADHGCPNQMGITHIAGSITLTLVEDMWKKADQAYADLATDPANERFKGRVRGMCDMIVIFMPPHFRTSDEIARELIKRAASFEAGEPYETPGLMGRRYEMPSATKKYSYSEKTESAVNEAKEKTNRSKELSDQEKAAIKFGIDSGAFSLKELSKTYGVPEEVVNEIARG